MTGLMCASVACTRIRAEGSAYCPDHLARWNAKYEAEWEACRIDPTTDRDRWDDFTDGGLEAPGEDEF